MSRRLATLLVGGVLALALAAAGALFKVPYVELAPGPVTDTLGKSTGAAPLIKITGHPTYPTTGKLDLVTVAVGGGPPDPIDLFTALRGWLDRNVAVVPQ